MWCRGTAKVLPGSKVGAKEYSDMMFLQITAKDPNVGRGFLRSRGCYAIDIQMAQAQKPAGSSLTRPTGKAGKLAALSQKEIPLRLCRIGNQGLVVLFEEPYETPWWAEISGIGSSLRRLQLSRTPSGEIEPKYFNSHGSLDVAGRALYINRCDSAIKLETLPRESIPRVILAYHPGLASQGWDELPISAFDSPFSFSLEPERANLIFDTRNDKMLPINPTSKCNWDAALTEGAQLWEVYQEDSRIWHEFINSTFGSGLGDFVLSDRKLKAEEPAQVSNGSSGSRSTKVAKRKVLNGFRPYQLSFWNDPNFSFRTQGDLSSSDVIVYKMRYCIKGVSDELWVIERFTKEAAIVMLTSEELLMQALNRECERSELWAENKQPHSRVPYIKVHPKDGAKWNIQTDADKFLRRRWGLEPLEESA